MECQKFRILEILNFHPCECYNKLSGRGSVSRSQVKHSTTVSGRVLDLRLRDTLFDPHRRHYVVVIQVIITVYHGESSGRVLD